MCGIYARFHRGTPTTCHDAALINRGPDDYKRIEGTDLEMMFYRLRIVGDADGMQPFVYQGIYVMCNGEIYNYKDLAHAYKINLTTTSDCEIIARLYAQCGITECVQKLQGEFAFVIYDSVKRVVYFARDRIGRKGLYYAQRVNPTNSAQLEIASVMGAMDRNVCAQHVLPAVLYTYSIDKQHLSSAAYHRLGCFSVLETFHGAQHTSSGVYDQLECATRRRVKQADRPVGFLLSGGLDSSSLLAICIQKKFVTRPAVFTFGFADDAPDVIAAGRVVRWLKEKYGDDCIDWHLVIGKLNDGLLALRDTITAVETYDTTTIRASTPMMLISRYIKENTDVRVIISGEGADELFGGYLYNMYAPSDQGFREEIIKNLEHLYLYDCLRADRVTASCGLEVRCPFLDQNLVDYVLQSVLLKKPTKTTKELLRQALSARDLLPDDILWGKKEAFSDAVGLDWQSTIAEYVDGTTACDEFSPHIPPRNDTERHFQCLFAQLFPNQWHVLPRYWMPNQTWIDTQGESSARVLPVYSTM